MKRKAFLSLLATPILGQTESIDGSQTSDPVIGSFPRCLGTSTFVGYVPTETVFVTVDGNYTYSAASNDSTPTAAIFFTPPPACESIILPETATGDYQTTPTDDVQLSALPTSSIVQVYNTTYLSVTTWTETSTSYDCVPNLIKVPLTSKAVPPYANTSTTATEVTEVTESTESTATTDTSDAAATSDTRYCTPIFRFGTFANTATYSAQITEVSYAVSGSSAPPPKTNGPHQPQVQTTEDSSPPIIYTASQASSSVATVTITKKTPVAAPTTVRPNQIVFPSVTDDSNSLAAVTPKTSKKNTDGGGSNNTPASDGGSKPSGNNQPAGNPVQTSAGTAKTSAGGGNNADPAGTTSYGNGIGSIINSAFNSPFTSVGVTTSYGAASVTANLVNGVPVEVLPSSVYIGGSYVAIPTGSSTSLVTVAGQIFTVKSDGVVGGSSTVEIHRTEKISYSAVQAATLAASTITQNGIVVTIEPTAAIVDGKTYSIGLNAGSTTLVVKGQTITFNSDGIAFASTTYIPAMITAAAYVVKTIGGLTFSIDPSEAIISGTTFHIGDAAHGSLVTTKISGTQVIFGPSGIILASTTIAPTGVSFTGNDHGTAQTTGSGSAKVVSDANSGPTMSSYGVAMTSHPPNFFSNNLCILSALLAMAILPLSLLL